MTKKKLREQIEEITKTRAHLMEKVQRLEQEEVELEYQIEKMEQDEMDLECSCPCYREQEQVIMFSSDTNLEIDPESGITKVYVSTDDADRLLQSLVENKVERGFQTVGISVEDTLEQMNKIFQKMF